MQQVNRRPELANGNPSSLSNLGTLLNEFSDMKQTLRVLDKQVLLAEVLRSQPAFLLHSACQRQEENAIQVQSLRDHLQNGQVDENGEAAKVDCVV